MSTSKKNTQTDNEKTKIRVFRTQFNPNYSGSTGEINNEPSETHPDEALSVATLLKRHAKGIPLGVRMLDGQYYGELEIPRINDLTDLQRQKEELNARILETRKQIAEEKREAKRIREERELAERKKLLKQLRIDEEAERAAKKTSDGNE